MKYLPLAMITLGTACPLAAQETPPKWDVEIPGPIADGSPSEPAPKPEPIDFTVLNSRTTRLDVREAPPMPGLPPITGTVNLTVELVADPDLPPTPAPLPALPPDDPAVIARWAEFRESYRGTEIAFVSALVYDGDATLLRIYPSGGIDDTITAWSNVSFLHFSGFAGWRLHLDDGTFQDFGLMLGVSPVNSDTARRLAARAGREYEPPDIPELPDLATSGPAFIVVEGEADSRALQIAQMAHELYRKEGARMEAAFHAREAERAARKAHFLANPPEPSDITVRFWKRKRPTVPSVETQTLED